LKNSKTRKPGEDNQLTEMSFENNNDSRKHYEKSGLLNNQQNKDSNIKYKSDIVIK